VAASYGLGNLEDVFMELAGTHRPAAGSDLPHEPTEHP
jgi:hypothetical protein